MFGRLKSMYAAVIAAWHEPLKLKDTSKDGGAIDSLDPLEPSQHFQGDGGFEGGMDAFISGLPTAADFTLAENYTPKTAVAGNFSMDAADARFTMDDDDSIRRPGSQAYQVPYGIMNWYMSQSFIGWQACALLAQHWLMDKACRQAGEDAVRNGYELTASDGSEVSSAQLNEIRDIDETYEIDKHMINAVYWTNVFGIRVVMFDIQSDDSSYYEKPFNIDGVSKGSYKGIRQIDPYWMTPMLTLEGSSDPTSLHFYEPEFWVISGRKYHRSHLIILKGTEPADILKPLYYYGGIPMTQRIYERIYAAERTANEAPLLATDKRTTALHVDLKKLATNQAAFEARLNQWVQYRDNHQVKVMGLEESMEQFDTSLSDFDSVISSQYALVSAIAKVPITKLMQTSPSGFQATGEFEMKSYSQELEGIQKTDMGPFLKRHHEITVRHLGYDFSLKFTWRPTDAHTAKEKAEINKMNADTGVALINAGVISPDEERQRLRDDPMSGYGVLADNEDGEANTDFVNTEREKAEKEAEGSMGGEAPKAVATEGDDLVSLVSKLEHQLNPPNTFPLSEAPLAEQDSAASSAPAGSLAELTAAPTLEQLITRLTGHLNGTAPLYAPVTGNPAAIPGSPRVSGDLICQLERHIEFLKANPSQSKSEEFNLTQLIGQLMDEIQKLKLIKMPAEQIDMRHIYTGSTPPGSSVIATVEPSVVGLLGRAKRERRTGLDALDLPVIHTEHGKVRIENPKGSVRTGTDGHGKTWNSKMPAHYGFLENTMGADGDAVDAYVHVPMDPRNKVFIVNQNNPETGEFDEHKCFLGVSDITTAEGLYSEAYEPGWNGMGGIHELSAEEFAEWLKNGNTSLPYEKMSPTGTGSFAAAFGNILEPGINDPMKDD